MIILLHWALLTVSLIIAILMLWLAFSVLLNAQRRDWAIWLMGGALLCGAAFFLFHAVIISTGANHLTPRTIGRWPLFWAAGLLLPAAWYLVILWHAGFWQHAAFPRRRLHRAFLYISMISLGLLCVAYYAMPFSLTAPMEVSILFDSPGIAGIPCLTILYPLFITLAIGLSIDALSHPGYSRHFMGDLARRRARPWLFATSVILLLVSLCIAGIIFSIYLPIQSTLYSLTTDLPLYTMGVDLIICLLIALAILLLGQAIVTYEVFTGKTLPRHGLRKHWRRIIILAVGLSAVMAANIVFIMPPIYGTLLAAIIVSAFYALYNWRSFSERERHVASLRPFVSGPPIYDALTASSLTTIDVAAQFGTLCEEVLGAKTAYLEPLGSFASLVEPLAYPHDITAPSSLPDMLAQCTSPKTLCLPLEPGGEMAWAVPLWNGQGLIGMLWLGEKHDGRLYTEEEMEVARSTGERLIDTLAGIRLAQRLMQVQRGRLAESQVTDQRTRRMVHDEILPQLHTAILTMSAQPEHAEILAQLADVHRQLSNILREMPAATTEALKRQGLIKALHQVVHDEYRHAFDEIRWHLDPELESRIRHLSPVAAEVIFCAAREAIRNAARYGRGDEKGRPLDMTVALRWNNGIEIVIADNGVGIQEGAMPSRGSGQGTILHSTMMAVIGGVWVTESEARRYTRVLLSLPEARCR